MGGQCGADGETCAQWFVAPQCGDEPKCSDWCEASACCSCVDGHEAMMSCAPPPMCPNRAFICFAPREVFPGTLLGPNPITENAKNISLYDYQRETADELKLEQFQLKKISEHIAHVS